jgi:hypothetical protein
VISSDSGPSFRRVLARPVAELVPIYKANDEGVGGHDIDEGPVHTRVLMVMKLAKVPCTSPLGGAAPSCKTCDTGVDGHEIGEGHVCHTVFHGGFLAASFSHPQHTGRNTHKVLWCEFSTR